MEDPIEKLLDRLAAIDARAFNKEIIFENGKYRGAEMDAEDNMIPTVAPVGKDGDEARAIERHRDNMMGKGLLLPEDESERNRIIEQEEKQIVKDFVGKLFKG